MKLVLLSCLIFIPSEIAAKAKEVNPLTTNHFILKTKAMDAVFEEFTKFYYKHICSQSDDQTIQAFLQSDYTECLRRSFDRDIVIVRGEKVGVKEAFDRSEKYCGEKYGYDFPTDNKEICQFYNNTKIFEPHAACAGKATVHLANVLVNAMVENLREFEFCIRKVKVRKPARSTKGQQRTQKATDNIVFYPSDINLIIPEGLFTSARETAVVEAFAEYERYKLEQTCDEPNKGTQELHRDAFYQCVEQIFDSDNLHHHESKKVLQAYNYAPDDCGTENGYLVVKNDFKETCDFYRNTKLFEPHAICIGKKVLRESDLALDLKFERIPALQECGFKVKSQQQKQDGSQQKLGHQDKSVKGGFQQRQGQL